MRVAQNEAGQGKVKADTDERERSARAQRVAKADVEARRMAKAEAAIRRANEAQARREGEARQRTMKEGKKAQEENLKAVQEEEGHEEQQGNEQQVSGQQGEEQKDETDALPVEKSKAAAAKLISAEAVNRRQAELQAAQKKVVREAVIDGTKTVKQPLPLWPAVCMLPIPACVLKACSFDSTAC